MVKKFGLIESKMYLQITTKCNMTCEHCCFACGAKGDTMTIKTAEKALKLAREYVMTLTIGGGEPTLHPQFFEILGLSLSYCCDDIRPHVITNGKVKERALRLGQMGRAEILSVELSQTDFHDPISEEVLAFYKRRIGNTGVREIQSDRIIATGRAEDWGQIQGCACTAVRITPTGTMHFCGCLEAPVLGNVHDKNAGEILEKIMEDRADYEADCFKELEINKTMAEEEVA